MASNFSCATLMSLDAETKKLPFASGAWHDATAVCRASSAPSLAPDDSEDTCVFGFENSGRVVEESQWFDCLLGVESKS